MKKPNANGVYEAESTEELARRGRAYAAVKLCQCKDKRYRYALDMAYSYGGFCGPITAKDKGFDTAKAATEAAMQEFLRRFPKERPEHPASVHAELRELRAQIEARWREPTLF